MRYVDIANHFTNTTAAIFFTMAGLVVHPGKFFVKHDKKPLGTITAIIGVSGDRIGTIAPSTRRNLSTIQV